MSDKIPFSRVGFFPSFPQPVTPPSTDIKASPQLALCFNEDWLPLIMGAVKVLMRPETYKGDIPTVIDAVANASQLVSQIGECEVERTFRQDVCHLYTTLNGIETLIFNAQDCVNANLADGTLAKANSGYIGDIPSDDCHTYSVSLTIDKNWIAPNVVNTGDTLLLSNWQGGATDLGMLSTTWVCPSGTAYAFGGCTNTARAATIYGTDPLQSAPHLAVIAAIGSSYYDIWNSASGITPATFTVPSGVTNQPLRLLMNVGTAVGLVAAGEMWGEITICNKHQWCYEFDFTTGQHGWSVIPLDNTGYDGTYITGTGFQGLNPAIGINPGVVLLPTSIFVTSTNGAGSRILDTNSCSPGTLAAHTLSIANGSGIFEPAYQMTTTDWFAVFHGGNTTQTISKVKVYGSGTNPFGASNCT